MSQINLQHGTTTFIYFQYTYILYVLYCICTGSWRINFIICVNASATSLCSWATYVRWKRDTTRICCCDPCCGAVQQSIDISYPPGPQQQTRCTLLQRTNGTDRRTYRGNDRRTPYRFIDRSSSTTRAVPTSVDSPSMLFQIIRGEPNRQMFWPTLYIGKSLYI